MENSDVNSTGYRCLTAAFGVLFTLLAVAIIVFSDRTAGPVLAALVVGILGIDAIISAGRGKASLLSRIGPLP